ncbi:MAG: ferritin-like domain-containing protein [Novosphingobium sp.]|uniref:ferritin-like domain-containing protein n=1 Tax=Novosphingobium sp. TaxID=1874826 RepID=UPI0032BDAB97
MPTKAFADRYRDVLASVYLYNEFRGYTSLDRVLEAVRARCPLEIEFIAEVTKHRADERKHYLMFKRWFERQGRMPLRVDTGVGHIDRFIHWVFGCTIDQLDTAAIVTSADQFEQLCRVIMLTEQRGFRQVETLLQSPMVRADPVLRKIFEIIHLDEPDHFLPYQRWLLQQGRVTAKWNERAADWCIHKVLILAKLPALFLDAERERMAHWPDQAAQMPA